MFMVMVLEGKDYVVRMMVRVLTMLAMSAVAWSSGA
jgi:hypothetical protein